MARIRSIHPGLFADEAFVSASPMARLLVIGIWTEAWDDGVFEWKALTLKMRIFPADSVDVAPLLDELASLNMVKPFEAMGKRMGAIRNFCKFQRPKKPNSSGMLPNSLRSYVAISTASSEQGGEYVRSVPPQFGTAVAHGEQGSPPVTHQFGTSGENRKQMEDGGGVGGGKDNPPAQRPVPYAHAESDHPAAERPPEPGAVVKKSELDQVEAACRAALGEKAPLDVVVGPIVEIVRKFGQERVSLCLASEARRPRESPIRTWKIWARVVDEQLSAAPVAKAGPAVPAEPEPEKIRLKNKDIVPKSAVLRAIERWNSGGMWNETLGGPPGRRDCVLPPEMLALVTIDADGNPFAQPAEDAA